MIMVRWTKNTEGGLKPHSIKGYKDVYDPGSKLCHYCHRYDRGRDKQPLKFGPPSLIYFDRGRSKRWVHTCWDCANAKKQFCGPTPHTRVSNIFQKIEAWHAVFDVIVKQYGDPIALVEATKIAASRNEIAKNYFGVKDKFSEERCNETFLELIYYLLTHERYYLYHLKKIDYFSCSNNNNDEGRSIQVNSPEPIIMVKSVDGASDIHKMRTATIEERRERRRLSQFIVISTLLLFNFSLLI